MRLLRSLLFIVAALLLQSCLWRPPPIPPDRNVSDSGISGGGNDASNMPPFSDASAAFDAGTAQDSGFVSDHDAQPDAGEAEADGGNGADGAGAADGANANADADASAPDADAPDAGDRD